MRDEVALREHRLRAHKSAHHRDAALQNETNRPVRAVRRRVCPLGHPDLRSMRRGGERRLHADVRIAPTRAVVETDGILVDIAHAPETRHDRKYTPLASSQPTPPPPPPAPPAPT